MHRGHDVLEFGELRGGGTRAALNSDHPGAVVGALAGALANQFVRLSIFGGMDRLGGFACGALRGLLLLGIFVILGQLVHLDREHWWHDSHLIPTGESIANALRFLVGEVGVPHSRDIQV